MTVAKGKFHSAIPSDEGENGLKTIERNVSGERRKNK